jgi:hypothetical protein
MVREEDYFTNPRLEMAPEDYAPAWHPHDDYDDVEYPEEGEDDE